MKFRTLFIIALILPSFFISAKNFKSQKRKEIFQMVEEMHKSVSESSWENVQFVDSSSFTQFLYQKIFQIEIPRDSYSQYLATKEGNNFRESPRMVDGSHDENSLKNLLEFGDLLFWINTYNGIPIERKPPVSMVMVYLGISRTGEMLMVGWGKKGIGAHEKNGGIDIYKFYPNRLMGCIRDEEDNCVIEGDFLGYGRILSKEELMKKIEKN
ncbi:MAG: C40 family peptidase [Leptospiraceae bacterium]|nr:C40 family peptidase [Leptospiraceae bacterium]MCP5510617.1 C40 family peptidase [Leptospiraceae bacterium]